MSDRTPVIETIGPGDAPAEWRGRLAAIASGDRRILIEEGGVPVAAIISAADFERLEREERQRREAMDAVGRMRAAFADVPPEDLEQQVLAITREVRREVAEERRRTGTAR